MSSERDGLPRLEAAYELLPRNCILADVGCDHGMLCKAALEGGKAKRVYACDISAPSLDKARKVLNGFDNVQFVCCDGLKKVPRDYTAVTLCGMGGETVLEILQGLDRDVSLIVQPQTHAADVRRTLSGSGYALKREILAFERGRFYPVMLFERGERRLDELEETFGLNAHEPSPLLVKMAEKLIREHEKYPQNPRSSEILRLARTVTENVK